MRGESRLSPDMGRVWALSGPQELSGAAAAGGRAVRLGGRSGPDSATPPTALLREGGACSQEGPWVCHVGPPVSLDLGLWLEERVGASWPGSRSHPRRE